MQVYMKNGIIRKMRENKVNLNLKEEKVKCLIFEFAFGDLKRKKKKIGIQMFNIQICFKEIYFLLIEPNLNP